jgi:hypothetical protein
MLEMAGWTNPVENAAAWRLETDCGAHWTEQGCGKVFHNEFTPPLVCLKAAPGFDWAGCAAGGLGQIRMIVAQDTVPQCVYAEEPVETLQAWQAFHGRPFGVTRGVFSDAQWASARAICGPTGWRD